MQGFPDTFEFPVSPTQAIKQLGNSVAVDAVRVVGKNVIDYMNSLNSNRTIKRTKNKGEWSELYAFVKILAEQQILLSDENLEFTSNYFQVNKVTGKNINLEFLAVARDRL